MFLHILNTEEIFFYFDPIISTLSEKGDHS